MFDDLVETTNDESTTGDASVPLPAISEDGPPSSEARRSLHSLGERGTSSSSDDFHNSVLAELASDGEWPFQTCQVPYFLMLSRSILGLLADPTRPFRDWGRRGGEEQEEEAGGSILFDAGGFVAAANRLVAAPLWNARAVVAHRRLVAVRRDDDDGTACPALWNEGEEMFRRAMRSFCERRPFEEEDRNAHVAASVMLEWGLAQHHFRKCGRGKAAFHEALAFVKLEVEVTGAEGKRTKYQKVCCLRSAVYFVDACI
jgi:hypothetical protein